jgi:hypothetical protein
MPLLAEDLLRNDLTQAYWALYATTVGAEYRHIQLEPASAWANPSLLAECDIRHQTPGLCAIPYEQR